ncbi:major facilitator superfamily domain-containing protein [Lineolata rhizophorae]|uniref:Probable transporter MCH1 n=1 Tax=Lineolata rhizophorae TaxID=578093 RepID=A0A6A6PB88_9PEZI|nr:major facilitator superfamily domain-containing protein [Lineolata rhizophorae]
MPEPSWSGNARIDKLDFPGPDARRPLLSPDRHAGEGGSSSAGEESGGRPSNDTSYAGSFFEHVAVGIQERERKKLTRKIVRYGSFAWAIVNCLCAGSITAYSLYGHLFQSRLHYSQFQVNMVSIAAELAMYLPVPAFGYLCDRLGPAIPSMLSGAFFGVGYLLAAFSYKSGPPPSADGNGWPFAVMIVGFVGVGMGTSCMYLSGVTTCAKNFGRGKHKGLALAMPIAAFGLSGMWQSQLGSRLLYERRPDGSKGDVDVHRYFLFLGILLLAVGLIGGVALRIVDEEELIDAAVEDLARSGLLAEEARGGEEDGETQFFLRAAAHRHGYGSIVSEDGSVAAGDLSDSTREFLRSEAEEMKAHAEEERRKKNWLLNGETRRFLADHTMWWLAAGFFLVTGPGEAFINNLGTIIGTLYASERTKVGDGEVSGNQTSAATHVSIVAITSTVARLVTGTLSDLLAPPATSERPYTQPTSQPTTPAFERPQPFTHAASSVSPPPTKRRFRFQLPRISRLAFLLAFSLLLSFGQVCLATGLAQQHGERFWVVSACVGAGYGAVFSLVPIVVSVVWGVENFGTNWGIVAMMPAIGAAVWGVVYSGVYQAASGKGDDAGGEKVGMLVVKQEEDTLCYGKDCYAPTFWAMAVSVWVACGLWTWAWRGPGGWKRRGIAV